METSRSITENSFYLQVKITESFVWSVDYVAEKIRTSRQEGEDIDKFVVVYFDYAGEHDVPPKLDVAIRYPLMNDILSLYCHLHSVKWETMVGNALDSSLDSGDQMELVDRENNNQVDAGQVLSYNGLTKDTFTETSAGRELQEAIDAAKNFFKENPDWLGETLEVVGNVATPTPNQKRAHEKEGENGKREEGSTTDGSESPDNQTISQESSPTKIKVESKSSEDPAYKERQKRRMKEEEMSLDLLQDEKKIGEITLDKVNGKQIPSTLTNGHAPPRKSISLVETTANHSLSSNQFQVNGVSIPGEKSYPGKISRTVSNPNDGDLLRKEFQLNSPDFNKIRNPTEKHRNSKSQSSTTLQKMNGQYTSDDSILSNGLDEDLQLKEDVEFIQNYDVHHAGNHIPTIPPLQSLQTKSLGQPQLAQPVQHLNDLDPIVLDLDLSEYTPPEDFITLANQLDDNHGRVHNGLVNRLDETSVAIDNSQDNEGFVNPIFDTNANKLGVKSLNHFVIDFVDPSVKQKPDPPLNRSNSSST